MRVVVVDDERRLLDTLERRLFDVAPNWDFRFAVTGEDALAMLDERPADVVVSDLRMPGMDGAALLAEVWRRHPATVRIVLSGEADEDLALRVVPVAHQYLAKPCDGRRLIEVLERAARLRALLGSQECRALVGRVAALPPAPRRFAELTRALRDPEVDLRTVSSVIAQDPVIAAKVLQLVNSSFFARGRAVVDVHGAVARLGLRTVRAMVLSAEVFAHRGGGVVGAAREHVERCAWRASTIVSRIIPDPVAQGHAITAALLTEVSRLVVDLPGGAEAEAEAVGEAVPLHLVERAHFGVSHAELGAFLLGTWNLPDPIVEAVAYHHDPSRGGRGLGVTGAVHVATAIAHEEAVDLAYVEAAGVADDLPRWLELADEAAA